MRIVCPAKITAISCSPDGNYCTVAHLDKIYVWQVRTKSIFAILVPICRSLHLLLSMTLRCADSVALWQGGQGGPWPTLGKFCQKFWLFSTLFGKININQFLHGSLILLGA